MLFITAGRVSIQVFEGILIDMNFFFGKDYSGANFLYTETISLKKAHSTK